MKRLLKQSLAAILAASMLLSSSGMVSLGASIRESSADSYSYSSGEAGLGTEADSTNEETSAGTKGGGKTR